MFASGVPSGITSVAPPEVYSGWYFSRSPFDDFTCSSNFLPEDPSEVPPRVLSWIPPEVPFGIHSEISQEILPGRRTILMRVPSTGLSIFFTDSSGHWTFL